MNITVTKLTSPDLARLACGFFAGLSFSQGWAWCLAVIWAAWTGVRWVRAEIESTPTINEVEL